MPARTVRPLKPSEKKARNAEIFRDLLNVQPDIRDSRKLRVLEAVVSIIAKEGVDELTFERIGKSAGMARSHVVYYFPNRETLVLAAMQFAALSAQKAITQRLAENEGVDFETLLSAYVDAHFDWIAQHPEHASVYFLVYYEASFKKAARAVHTGVRDAGRRRIAAILKTGKRLSANEILARVNAIQALITGALIDVISTDSGGEYESKRRETRAMAHLLATAEGSP